MMMGFFFGETASLVVIFHCAFCCEKQYGADSFISVNILLVAKLRMWRNSSPLVTFFPPRRQRKKQFERKDTMRIKFGVKTFMMTNQIALRDSLFFVIHFLYER
jgi:hypothetical protein